MGVNDWGLTPPKHWLTSIGLVQFLGVSFAGKFQDLACDATLTNTNFTIQIHEIAWPKGQRL